MQISFDEAMGQEFVNVPLDELGNPIKSLADIEDGGATPVREDTAQEWWLNYLCHLINLFGSCKAIADLHLLNTTTNSGR